MVQWSDNLKLYTGITKIYQYFDYFITNIFDGFDDLFYNYSCMIVY